MATTETPTSEDAFRAVYNRVVRRFWAGQDPLTEREFQRMVEAEGLRYPGNRPLPPPTPAEQLRMGQ